MSENKFPAKDGGFTLIELLAAIGVASILMAIAIPSFLSTLPGLRLTDAARQVATDLQQTRMKALAQDIPYQIAFSSTTYVMQKCNGSCTNDGSAIALPEGISAAASTAPQFQPRGTAVADATITLSNGSTTTLVCVKTVGRISIQNAACS